MQKQKATRHKGIKAKKQIQPFGSSVFAFAYSFQLLAASLGSVNLQVIQMRHEVFTHRIWISFCIVAI